MPGLSAAPGLAPQATAAAAADTGIVLTADQCAEKLGDGIEDAVRFAWLQDWVVQQHGINQ
jgi:hypothetical protein